MITLGPEQRAELSRQARALLDRQPWDLGELPQICRWQRSTRLPRAAGSAAA